MGVICFLALDSNLGDREKYLMNALHHISLFDKTSILSVSHIWEGYPVGYLEQEKFLNMAIKITTELLPAQFLEKCLNIECLYERQKAVRWGPRTINVDLLLYGDLEVNTSQLQVPHQDLWKSAFILVPLKDVYDGEFFFERDLDKLIDETVGENWVKFVDENQKEHTIKLGQKEWGYIWKEFSMEHWNEYHKNNYKDGGDAK